MLFLVFLFRNDNSFYNKTYVFGYIAAKHINLEQRKKDKSMRKSADGFIHHSVKFVCAFVFVFF